MFFKTKKDFKPKEIIFRTLFLTSLVSFVVFLVLDLSFSGFVSRVFFIHWFLLAAIVSGIGWGVYFKD